MTIEQRQPLLEIKDLEIDFVASTGTVHAVRKANFVIYPGQTVAIVGESGSGKSTLAAAIIGLLANSAKIAGGQIIFDGQDIVHYSDQQMQEIRGSQIGMVPQDPMSNLNPVWSIGYQVKEALKVNNATNNKELQQEVYKILGNVGIDHAEKRSKQYPHEFSGGMRQRALIAIGLSAKPKLLIADEPTSALDVTVQKKILDHLAKLTHELGTSMLFITHDLGLAAERADTVVVMHRGRVVEYGSAIAILQNPLHPYTKRLVTSAPSLSSKRLTANNAQPRQVIENQELIKVENLTKVFKLRGAKGHKDFLAVDNVSFTLEKGTTLALVGESGSGKSTVANIILNLLQATSGSVYYEGTDLAKLNNKELFLLRRKMQVVFQNTYGSLDPMFSIYRSIEEPLLIHGIGNKKEREDRVAELLDLVALPRSVMRRYPNELSGGQRQRVAIARALALNPEVVVLDEAVSALDVLVQNQILQLLTELQHKLHLSYLFITHDLAVVRQVADKVVVMEKGKIVEQGSTSEIFANPQQDYTKELIASVPGANIKLASA